MTLTGIKKHRQRVQELFSLTDQIFLLLRLATIMGSVTWLSFAPLTQSISAHYYLSLAIFSLYSLIIYILIFFKAEKIRIIYMFSLLLDLSFVFHLVDLDPNYNNSFFLSYYLLVILHTLYFGLLFGGLVATLSMALYFVNILPYTESIHWTDLGIRFTFLYLTAFPAGIIHEKLKKDKQNIETLNDRLTHSIDRLKTTQAKLIETEKLAAIGRLTNSVAHEIRNPLMSLGGFSRRLIKLLADNTKEQQYARAIVSEVARLESILSDTLLFTAEKEDLKRQDLNPVVRDAIYYYIDLYSNSQHYFTIEEYHPELPQIYLDPEQLRLAIGNLIANSIDAMPGGGTLHIKTDRVFIDDMDWLTLAIADTGQGISPQQLKLIFEPFHSTKRVGTGLGLAIVHEIMEEHRGFIKADSKEGSGTTFTLYFPFQPVEEDSKTPCWKSLGCGIETDPSRRCPAYPYFGRSCWATAGTLCQSKVTGTFAEKINDCRHCSFFQRCTNSDDKIIPASPAPNQSSQTP